MIFDVYGLSGILGACPDVENHSANEIRAILDSLHKGAGKKAIKPPPRRRLWNPGAKMETALIVLFEIRALV
jgi:hypothetical protein